MVLMGRRFFEHGSQSVFCTDLIRSKSWPHGQDFVINLKGSNMWNPFCYREAGEWIKPRLRLLVAPAG
ncbi:hypothetical protein D9980_10985 [Serratia sp. 3ACOL1]|nr:hypothetical protein D9980_10985 [Serratia sp. 3ACOL1]